MEITLTHPLPYSAHMLASRRQSGVSLIIVLLLLVIVSILGVASMQIATMGERAARNDRDMQLAFQAAENALVDAEIDLGGPNIFADSRTAAIQAGTVLAPESGCASTAAARGICSPTTTGSIKPTWLLADFTNTDSLSTVAAGTFTGRNLANASDSTGLGIQSALAPRYLVEVLPSDSTSAGGMVTSNTGGATASGAKANIGGLFRITAMGFGPRSSVQTVLQTIYRN